MIPDRSILLWMDWLWQVLIKGRSGHVRLISMDQNEIVSRLGVVSYSLRNEEFSGTSWKDSLPLRNQLTGTKKRRPRSVSRYQKVSKLLSTQLIDVKQSSTDIEKAVSSVSSSLPWESDLCLNWSLILHWNREHFDECKSYGQAKWCTDGILESLTWNWTRHVCWRSQNSTDETFPKKYNYWNFLSSCSPIFSRVRR